MQAAKIKRIDILSKISLLVCPLYIHWDFFSKINGLRFSVEAATKRCSSKYVFCTCFQTPWNIPVKEFRFGKGAGKRFAALARLISFKSDLKKKLQNPYRTLKMLFRDSRPEMSYEKGVLKNFVKFTGKHLCESLFFDKVTGLRFATLLKTRLCLRRSTVNFAISLRTSFLIEHLRWLLLAFAMSSDHHDLKNLKLYEVTINYT